MTKLESIAIAILVVASGAYIINTMSNSDEKSANKQEASTTVSATAPAKKPVKQNSQPLPPPRHNTNVNHAALPVEHGYADDSGKQINPETGERLPPPPPAPAPRKRGNSPSSHSAHQHGHETENSTHKRGSDVPPPVGANG